MALCVKCGGGQPFRKKNGMIKLKLRKRKFDGVTNCKRCGPQTASARYRNLYGMVRDFNPIHAKLWLDTGLPKLAPYERCLFEYFMFLAAYKPLYKEHKPEQMELF